MARWYQTSEIARPEYYDRQPIPVFCAYSNVVAPAGGTIRATYTPPANYAAFVEVVSLSIRRATAAAPAQAAAFYLNFLPFYGGSFIVLFVTFDSNVVGDVRGDTLSSLGYMAFGDSINLTTFDFSVGGTLQFTGAAKATEFVY